MHGLSQEKKFNEIKFGYIGVRSRLSDLVIMDTQENSSVTKDAIFNAGQKVDLAFTDLLDFDPLTADVALEKANFLSNKIVVSGDMAEYQKEALQQVLDDFALFL